MTFDKEKILHYCNSISENTLMQTLNIKYTDAGPDFLVATMPVTWTIRFVPDKMTLNTAVLVALIATTGLPTTSR